MTATHATENLAAALAAFQAAYPAISKGDTATVPIKTGGTYSYTYANLADISEIAMPLLGKLGLAFTSKPTLLDNGKFVLAYSLLHVSGEREDGIYPLNGSTPQGVGGEITYARRYALCAVTGIAPADSDDDAQAAQQEARARVQSAGAAFDSAARRPGGAADIPPEEHWQTPAPPSTDQEWLATAVARASAFTARDEANALWAEGVERQRDGRITPTDARQVADMIKARFKELAAAGQEAGPVEGVVVTGLDEGDPWADKVADILSGDDADAALADLEVSRKAGMDGRHYAAVKAAISARSASLRAAVPA